MKYYFDTNIWIAVFIDKHPKHKPCLKLITDCIKNKIEMVTSGHCLAEVYSVLTKLPIALRLPPEMATNLIEKNIADKCTIIDLTWSDYIETLTDAAERNLVSGAIFDGLHVKAALKGKVNKIFTYNLRDFERFGIPKEVILGEPE